MNISSINDNKLFWKTVCLLFLLKNISPKGLISDFFKKDVTNDEKSAQTFNNFSKYLVNTLNIETEKSILSETGKETDSVETAIEKYIKFPGTLRVKRLIKNP